MSRDYCSVCEAVCDWYPPDDDLPVILIVGAGYYAFCAVCKKKEIVNVDGNEDGPFVSAESLQSKEKEVSA